MIHKILESSIKLKKTREKFTGKFSATLVRLHFISFSTELYFDCIK